MSFKITKLNSDNIFLAKSLFLLFQIDDEVENPTIATDDYLEKLLSRDDFHVLVATENEEIIGGLTAYELRRYKNQSTEMFLYELVVEKSQERKGIATKLIEYLKDICLEKGIDEMFLATEMDNEPAKKLCQLSDGKFEEAAIYSFNIN